MKNYKKNHFLFQKIKHNTILLLLRLIENLYLLQGYRIKWGYSYQGYQYIM